MPKSDKGGNELFYVDKDGKKQDASLHEELLNNPEADKFAIQQSRKIALKAGIPLESVNKLLPEK